MYLDPVEDLRPPTDQPSERDPLWDFLEFNERLGELEHQRAELLLQLQRAQEAAYIAGQYAAQHGSRLYEMDEDSELRRDVEGISEFARFVDADDPGVLGLETAQEAGIRHDLEQIAAEREREVRRIQDRLERLDREIARAEQNI
jgi:hypothetical protein